MAANAIFAFPNRVDATFYTVAFSNGSWQGSLPLTNLRDPLLQNIARSVDNNLTSTKFDIDLGAPRAVLVVAVPKGNFCKTDRFKLTGANDSGFTQIQYAGDWTDVFPVIYPFGSLTFEDPSWWDGKVPDEDAANYPQPVIVVMPNYASVVARYWRLEFDITNRTGSQPAYLDLARLVIAPGWQPTVNIVYGAQLGWQTGTVAQESLGGVVFFDPRTNKRNLKCGFDILGLQEALNNPFEMQRKLGINLQAMVIYDPSDTANMPRRSFLATMSRLNPLTENMYNNAPVQLEFLEVV